MNANAKLIDTEGLIKELFPDPKMAPSRRTIDRARKQGQIPFVKLGGLIYFDPTAVREALLKLGAPKVRPEKETAVKAKA